MRWLKKTNKAPEGGDTRIREVFASPAKTEVPTSRCKAKGCRVRFVKLSMGHRACSVEHARLVVAQDKAEKARKEARDHREARAEAKPLSHHHRLTKDAVHAYIRARDADLPCISCDTLNPSAWHAGHYMSVGSESALSTTPPTFIGSAWPAMSTRAATPSSTESGWCSASAWRRSSAWRGRNPLSSGRGKGSRPFGKSFAGSAGR